MKSHLRLRKSFFDSSGVCLMNEREEIMRQTAISFLRAAAVQAAATAAAVMILALVMLKTEADTGNMQAAVYLCYGLVCCLGGFLAAGRGKNRNFLRGAVSGGIYFLLLLSVSCGQGMRPPEDKLKIWKALGVCIGSGMAGGMVKNASFF